MLGQRNGSERSMLQSVPKFAIGVGVVSLMLAAAYLYAVRGGALLLDLTGLTRGLICF